MLELAEMAVRDLMEIARVRGLVVVREGTLVMVAMGPILTSHRVMLVLAVVVALAQAIDLLLVLTPILVLVAVVELGY